MEFASYSFLNIYLFTALGIQLINSIKLLYPIARKDISIYKLSMPTDLGFEKDFVKDLTALEIISGITCYENSMIFCKLICDQKMKIIN